MTTNKKIETFLKSKLSSDKAWVQRAIIRVFEFQTADEQTSNETKHHNDIGFSGADANILSSFAKTLNKGWNLSDKQLTWAFRLVPKYWKQIWSLIPEDKQKAILASLQA